MQKCKRIKKWDTAEPDRHVDHNNNLMHSTATTITTETTTRTAASTLPNWTKEPQDAIGNCSYKRGGISSNKNSNVRASSNMVENQRSRTPAASPPSATTSACSSVTLTVLPRCNRCEAARPWLLALVLLLIAIESAPVATVRADDFYTSTQPLRFNATPDDEATSSSTTASLTGLGDAIPGGSGDSIFMKIARRFSTGNELWDGIVRDCYRRPSFSCFQKNVYTYLSDTLQARDVNVTQRLKFYRNSVDYSKQMPSTTESAASSAAEDGEDASADGGEQFDEHLQHNEIPRMGRAVAETPIEEVTNALYGKSVKFAMTHDVELKLPEMMFDGATFRISPRSFEGNGIIAKLELIPKQEIEARLAGKIIKKKIQKFLKNKVLLSFIALILIIKIIKIKLFWLLPLVIGIGAAKKLMLKFLLFLFPALAHLFKLCSYYQQTYHSTKYHHHHHLINHHHTVVPPWHSGEHSSVPEIIYTHPPKGHISAYFHGAPIHETYGPPPHQHYEGGWENSGPGLGSDYIGDINRAAQIEGNSNYFVPHTSDANEIHAWGLGSTQPTIQQQQQQHQQHNKQRIPATQQQRPPPLHRTPSAPPPPAQPKQQHPQHYQKPHATSHSFNPFQSPDKPSIFGAKTRGPVGAQSMPSPVYVPQRSGGNTKAPPPGAHAAPGLSAAQIAAQYDPGRNNPQQQQQQLSPELSAQVKEAIRIQAEQRLIAQQQQILEHQPFVQDGQPILPKNYDPYYSPLLLKIDKIVEQLGVADELCKERLVCSMYKDPARYSPHSNFVSAELSRDISELEPVTNANEAVVRFYRLIQAARDGQDQRDCLHLYPQCSINTE